MTGERPLRHAIKNSPLAHHLHYSEEVPGFRWPARSADRYANDPDHKNAYVGDSPQLVMGSLLAVKPEVKAEEIGLETEPDQLLLQVLHDYGAYICEDAGWDVFDFIIERGVEVEFEAEYGFSMKSDTWRKDVIRVAEQLCVIANNGPESIGG
ncbi:MAG: hypothetical protein AAGJ79_14060, partial [Verrucomicrobiota bacterium]